LSPSFDPACDFLLASSDHESLFERSGPGEIDHRCKGCRQIVKRWDRMAHWAGHKQALRDAEQARKAQLVKDRVQNLARAREARRRAKETA